MSAKTIIHDAIKTAMPKAQLDWSLWGDMSERSVFARRRAPDRSGDVDRRELEIALEIRVTDTGGAVYLSLSNGSYESVIDWGEVYRFTYDDLAEPMAFTLGENMAIIIDKRLDQLAKVIEGLRDCLVFGL